MGSFKSSLQINSPEVPAPIKITFLLSSIPYGLELIKANKENLPLIKTMLDQVADDAQALDMDKEELMEEFMIAYQDSLLEIGLDSREIARMALAALV